MCNPFHRHSPSPRVIKFKKLGFTGIGFSYLENPLKNTSFPSNDRNEAELQSIIYTVEGEEKLSSLKLQQDFVFFHR